MISIVDAGGNGLADEVVIDVGPQPVGVGKLVVRTCRDEQPLRLQAAIREPFPRVMAIESEATLETTTHLRQMLEPASVRRHVVAISQTIACAKPLECEVGEWCRRFPDCKTRVTSPLHEYDVVP